MGARARAKNARARAKKSADEWGKSSARLPAVLELNALKYINTP